MKRIVLSLIFCLSFPFSVYGGTEIMQILVFDWDEKKSQLVLKSLGSGTAIDKNLVLTNRHVVEHTTGINGEFMLLCQAQVRQARKTDCKISAGIAGVHPDYDVALLRVISEDVFLPQVKLSKGLGAPGQSVRVMGFPTPLEGLQNFGGNVTVKAVEAWLKSPKKNLVLSGDALTTTRGKVLAKARVKETGEALLYTNARVNFGNSGGAAFDQFGRYIGIPSFMDKNGNAFILSYWQLDDWVKKNAANKVIYSRLAQNFFERATRKTTKKILNTRQSSGSSAKKSYRGSRRPTSRRYNRYQRKTYLPRNASQTLRYNY